MVPRFTVLVPTHNRADVLPFALRSILAQTLTDFELLVVGDGCTDDTALVVDAFTDERLRWLDLPKAPHFGYANRNRALREARGMFIAYLGHDDLWLPDHLERLGALLERPGIELAYSRTLFVSRDGIVSPQRLDLGDPVTLDRFLAHTEGVFLGPGCVVHTRACLEQYGYWREDLPGGADMDLWIRIIEGGNRRNYAYDEVPTFLHFLADWRQEPLTHRLLRRLRRPDASLRLSVPAGTSEQEAVWEALAADPTGWTERLRRGVRIELDRRLVSRLLR